MGARTARFGGQAFGEADALLEYLPVTEPRKRLGRAQHPFE